MKNKIIILSLLLPFYFLSCINKNNRQQNNSLVKIYFNGKFLIKEICDSGGVIISRQYFNKDTVPDGALIQYYNNGRISSWRWFIANKSNPLCGIFYNEQGKFDTLKGSPFIDAIIDSQKDDT